MTWVAWRQFRTQTWFALVSLAVAAAVLVVTAAHVADLYSTVSSCHANCQQTLNNFLVEARAGISGVVYNLSVFGIYLVPPLLGAFWGAPLVARELEAGTHRLAWNQTVTRTRWILTKLAVVGGAAMLTAGLLSLAASLALNHIDNGDRIEPVLFGARGVVPVAYAAFAVTLGVAAGALIRRTVPAMAATLAVYLATVLTMALAVRAHLMPLRTLTAPITGDRGSVHGVSLSNHDELQVFGGAEAPAGSWTVSDRTLTHAGKVFTGGPASEQYCGGNGGPDDCFRWIGSLGLHQEVKYQPASHFWALQWMESGIFLALALLLAGLTLWWTRRRLT